MNKEEILNMPAGREMDALVAECVMKLNVVSRNHPCGYEPECGDYEASHFIPAASWHDEEGPVYLPDCGIYPPVPESDPKFWEGNLYCIVNPVPFYSKDISSAWELVLHFQEMGWCPNLINDDNGHWALSFIGVNDIPCTTQTSWVDYSELWCDDAPHAICKACLLAVYEEDEENE